MQQNNLLKDSTGKLSAYAWPGGYPIFYITKQVSVICPACANVPNEEDPPIAFDINWEDPDLYCDDCGKIIESAYAE